MNREEVLSLVRVALDKMGYKEMEITTNTGQLGKWNSKYDEAYQYLKENLK